MRIVVKAAVVLFLMTFLISSATAETKKAEGILLSVTVVESIDEVWGTELYRLQIDIKTKEEQHITFLVAGRDYKKDLESLKERIIQEGHLQRYVVVEYYDAISRFTKGNKMAISLRRAGPVIFELH